MRLTLLLIAALYAPLIGLDAEQAEIANKLFLPLAIYASLLDIFNIRK